MNYYLAQITASHCCVCRARLTDAESVEHGIGPTCSRRYYSPLHVPTDDNVRDALGHLAAAGLPDDIVDAFLAVVDNNHVNARTGCNLLIKWASAHYNERDLVLGCAKIIRALGYVELADKLENDRTAATIYILADKVEAYIPDKYTLERDMKGIPKADRMTESDGTPTKLGHKVGWVFPLAQLPHFEAVLGVHCGGELACGTKGVTIIARKRKADVMAFRFKLKSAPTVGGVVQLVPTPTGRVEVYSPYNQAFIDALKASIPKGDRLWTGRCWTVSSIFREVLRNLVFAHYGETV